MTRTNREVSSFWIDIHVTSIGVMKHFIGKVSCVVDVSMNDVNVDYRIDRYG
jgi:tetrahydromethanopterin S-methyltransferase subunit C